MKKTVVFTLSLITLLALGIVHVQPVTAKFLGGITIDVDGSIIPTTPSLSRTGDVYSLNEDITQSVVIYKSNIVFDGNGHSVSGCPIYILDVSNVTVRNLTITNGYKGISVADSSDVVITNNTIRATGNSAPFSETHAISIIRGNSTQVLENNLINNMVGIALAETSDNLIIRNNITDCSNLALGFYNSSQNRIYNNNLLNNSVQFHDWGIGLYPYRESRNTWDNGSIFGGNYWSDYQTKHPDTLENSDTGIGTVPYVVDEWNQDNYPLIEPFTSAFYAVKTTAPKIEVLAPQNQLYNDSCAVPLTFSVDKQASWMGYSLDWQSNVTVSGNQTLPGISSGAHTLIIYANDSYGNMGNETVSFTVSPSALETIVSFLPAIAIGVVVALIGAGLAVYLKKRRR